MNILDNTYCPLPFRRTEDEWYDAKRNANGGHAHIFAPTGRILPFQMCADISAMPQNPSVSVSHVRGTNISATYTPDNPSWDSCVLSNMQNVYKIKMFKKNGYYKLELHDTHGKIADGCLLVPVLHIYQTAFLQPQLEGTDKQMIFRNFVTNTDFTEVKITGLFAEPTIPHALTLVDCDGNRTDITSDVPMHVHGLDQRHTTNDLAYCLMFDGTTISYNNVGTHYLELSVGGDTYVSEPFQFIINDGTLVKFRYSRTNNIYADGMAVCFSHNGNRFWFEAYVLGDADAPPFSFEEDAESLDGYMFVTKRVSYKQHECGFVCGEPLADALRMMWHCNMVYVTDDGTEKRAEYFDAPKIEWVDNHLCTATLKWRTDCIVATYGEDDTHTNVMQGQSYGGDFDNSFNI